MKDQNIHESLLAKYDYIIVGAGSAGCVVARRLADSGHFNILLLEAGGSDEGINSIANPMQWPENIGSPMDYFYQNEPSPMTNHRTIALPRGKVLGGSSSINGLIWARGHKADYDGWAAAGNDGWNYDAVLPLFKKIEDWEEGETDFHGAGGPMRIENAKELHPVASALIEAGVSYGMPYLKDTNGPEPEGIGPMSLNIKNGRRWSTADGYLKPVMGNDKLTVLTGAQVLKLNFTGTNCIGLDFVQNGVEYSVAVSKEVILSAGAIDTPRILMLSGIGDHEELRKIGIKTVVDLPAVGKNLQDHPMIWGLCYEAREPLGPMNYNLSGSDFYWKSDTKLTVPDLMFVPIQIPLVTETIQTLYPPTANSFCILPSLVRPQSRGYLKMVTAKHDGPLTIQPNYLSEQADLDAMIKAVELGMDLASEPALKNIIKKWIAPTQLIDRKSIIEFIKNACSSYFHYVGTCAMGNGKDTVVNSKLKVHGIEGLRVVDASVMPSITTGNPNAPTMMIAEFASNLLLAANVEDANSSLL